MLLKLQFKYPILRRYILYVIPHEAILKYTIYTLEKLDTKTVTYLYFLLFISLMNGFSKE